MWYYLQILPDGMYLWYRKYLIHERRAVKILVCNVTFQKKKKIDLEMILQNKTKQNWKKTKGIKGHMKPVSHEFSD